MPGDWLLYWTPGDWLLYVDALFGSFPSGWWLVMQMIVKCNVATVTSAQEMNTCEVEVRQPTESFVS